MPLPLGEALPIFDGDYFVALVSRILHVGSAVILAGGLFYLRAVVAPQVAQDATTAEQLLGTRRRTWALVVMATTLLLIASGFYNLLVVIIWPNEPLPPLYHMMFGLKFLLSIGLFFIAAVLAGRSDLAQRLRGSLKLWLNLALVVALLIVGLAAFLRSVPKIPKVPDNLVATSMHIPTE